MAGTGQAVHRAMVLVDVERFDTASRTLDRQVDTRSGLYAAVIQALDTAGVPWDACYHEDRGDGLFVLVPPEHPKAPLVEVLPEALVRAVRVHNHTSHDASGARVRLAVHAGEVAFDEHGVTSTALIAAFRLLDAAPLKKALAESSGALAMIVSQRVFDEVVRESPALEPATFRPVEVTEKEFRASAWIALPDRPYPPDRAVLDRRSPVPALQNTAPRGRSSTAADHDPTGNAERNGETGPPKVRITGGVHSSGSGVAIGVATGDHLTIGAPPVTTAPAAGESDNPR